MQLTIKKGQQKGLMGGTSFEVRAQVTLSAPEQELVQHYKLQNEVLFSKTMVSIWGTPTDQKVEVRVGELLNGTSYKCKDLGEVINYTESLKSACESLVSYLDVAKSFGGEEVHVFPAPDAE